ncbi:hypothetical protein D3C81_1483380 [compost metagenome]
MVRVNAYSIFVLFLSSIKDTKACPSCCPENHISTGVVLYKRQLFAFSRVGEIARIGSDNLDVRINVFSAFDVTDQECVDARNVQSA